MSFPVYKKIAINSHQKRLLYSQLDQLDFGGHPYIFELGHMIKNQDECLIHIESYFDEHSINIYSYPIIIVANLENYKGQLTIINNIKQCPKFFTMRKKQLSTKESLKLRMVELKQKQLENLQVQEFMPVLNEYARTHKIISKLQKEHDFLNRISKELKS